MSKRTPLFHAHHAERYGRQGLISEYERPTGASLIVVIDHIFPVNITLLEELLFELGPTRPLHVLLASPGGDGETAIRMVRSLQLRCSSLTMILPDMAKSAATLMCLGADSIVMGPGGDLGPVDPQFQLGSRSLASAKEIVAAVDEAEERITRNPDTFPLFAGLLADVNMLMVDHSAVIPLHVASQLGLPAVAADPGSDSWALIWSLWTRYFTLGCFPAGQVAVYEGNRASNIIMP